MASFYHELYSKPNKRGDHAIRLVIIIDRKSVRKNSGFAVKPDCWDEVKRKVNRKHPNWSNINDALDAQLLKVEKEYASLIAEGALPGAATVHERATANYEFSELAERKIKQLSNDGSIGTVNRWKNHVK